MTTDIKICGLSAPETIDAAIDAGAAYIGLVHFPKSPRHVSLERAAELRAHAGDRVKTVLLLVNAGPEDMGKALATVKPDVLQFHGSETPEWIDIVRKKTGVEAWKAVGLRDRDTLISSFRFADVTDRILFDAPANKLPGGNGDVMDWSLLREMKADFDWGLAGGLTPGNVAEAIRKTGAPLVDVSSGVESEPGVKDVDKIRAFCQAVTQL